MSASKLGLEVDPTPTQHTPTREDILTIEQVAERLQVSARMVERLAVPCFYLGPRTRRYIWGTVVDFCERKTL